jgi:hypothetical protein
MDMIATTFDIARFLSRGMEAAFRDRTVTTNENSEIRRGEVGPPERGLEAAVR